MNGLTKTVHFKKKSSRCHTRRNIWTGGAHKTNAHIFLHLHEHSSIEQAKTRMAMPHAIFFHFTNGQPGRGPLPESTSTWLGINRETFVHTQKRRALFSDDDGDDKVR